MGGVFGHTFGKGIQQGSNVNQNPPFDSMLGRWEFNGDSLDISGNKNDFTTNNATSTTDRNGLPNQAYSFDGATQWMGRDSIVIPDNVFAFTLWFKASALTDHANIFGDANWGALDDGFSIEIYNGNIRFWIGGWTAVTASSNHIDIPFADTGSWHFVTCQYSKALGKMYFSLDNGTVYEATIDKTLLTFGMQVGNGFAWYTGLIDQIYFYNRILTDKEITKIYNYSYP